MSRWMDGSRIRSDRGLAVGAQLCAGAVRGPRSADWDAVSGPVTSRADRSKDDTARGGGNGAVTMRSRRARGRIGRARPVGMLTGSPTRRLNFPRAGSSRPHLGGLLRGDDALADEGGGGEHGGHLVRGTVSVTGRCDWRECVYGEARGRPRSNDIIRVFLGFPPISFLRDVTKRSTGTLKSVLREMGGTNYDTCIIRMRTRLYVVN